MIWRTFSSLSSISGWSVSTCSRALLNNSSSLSASRCWPQLQSSALTPTPFPRFPTGKLLHCNYIHNRGALDCIALLASPVFVQALRPLGQVLLALLQERLEVGGLGELPSVIPASRTLNDRLRANPLLQDLPLRST